MSNYDYGIAIHFEATCWFKQPTPRLRKSEIIEFTAVLFNFKTGEIEAEFHKHLKPTEDPKLSPFCIKLTGIQQYTVDNGVVLTTALAMFEEWLRKVLTPRNLHLAKMSDEKSNVAFVAWTDWELDVCLNNECRRKLLKMPAYFEQWIDLRANFQTKFEIKYTTVKFLDALKRVGLDFKGSNFSGLDDVKNLAALAYKMVSCGANLTITKINFC